MTSTVPFVWPLSTFTLTLTPWNTKDVIRKTCQRIHQHAQERTTLLALCNAASECAWMGNTPQKQATKAHQSTAKTSTCSYRSRRSNTRIFVKTLLRYKMNTVIPRSELSYHVNISKRSEVSDQVHYPDQRPSATLWRHMHVNTSCERGQHVA